MIFLYSLSFFLLSAGILLLLRVSPVQLLEAAGLWFRREPSLRQKIKQAQKPKKAGKIQQIIDDCKTVLKSNNKADRFSMLCTISGVFAVVGVLLASSTANVFLIPVMGGGFALIPFAYILFSATRFRQQLNAELETSLSTINTSYIRTDNFLMAVKENIQYLHSPVREVFERFLLQVENIDPDVKAALEAMKGDINHPVFHEWIDAVKLCQDDRNLTTTLVPIVSKLSDIRIVTGELQSLLSAPLQEYIGMAGFVWLTIPFLFFIARDWYYALMNSTAGQVVVSISAVVTFLSLIDVIRLTKPIEYRR